MLAPCEARPSPPVFPSQPSPHARRELNDRRLSPAVFDYADPNEVATRLNCTFAGVIAEDHFDAGIGAAFGVCEDVAAPHTLHKLAIATQCADFAYGARLSLEVRRVVRAALVAAEAAARNSTLATSTTASASWGIVRVLSNVPATTTPTTIGGLPAPSPRLAASAAATGTAASSVGTAAFSVGAEPRTFLAIRLEYTDYSPTYCSEACVRDGFTHPSGVRQPGTVEYATELSSYEVLEWTSVEVVTVQMGQPVSAIAGCDIYQQVLPATSLALSLMATQHPSVSTTSATQHIEFWLPHTSVSQCSWGGLGQLGGRYTWEVQYSAGANRNGIRVHELGHNLGLHHSGQMDVDGNALNEYGDYSAVMGSSARNNCPGFVLPNLITLGWLERNTHTRDWGGAAVVAISDLRVDPFASGSAGGALAAGRTYGVRLPVAGSNMAVWVSYRTGAGLDATLSSAVKGRLSVHYAPANGERNTLTYALGFPAVGTPFVVRPQRAWAACSSGGCVHALQMCTAGAAEAMVALVVEDSDDAAIAAAQRLCATPSPPPPSAALMAPPSAPPSPPPPPPPPSAPPPAPFPCASAVDLGADPACSYESEQFLQCMNDTKDEYEQCSAVYDKLKKQCQAQVR